jgi:hypothetical protein
MQLVMNQPGLASCQPADDLMVLVVCEDVTCGHAVCARLEAAGREARVAGRVIHAWWDFVALTSLALRQMAADEADRADLVFLIANDGAGLPAAVLDWINLWRGMNECRPQALVELLFSDTGQDGTSWRMLSQLEGLAGLGGLDLFSEGHAGELEAALASRVSAAVLRKQAAADRDACRRN